ncbi:hypothetical protein [Methanobacterium ferruginis]|uniref:hypothetical protein n=1 Tax=Methanobacterium ferruginis TaxID=710191 RepID=UPI002572EF16|nr:hypothetical protein [Methanobacterium ferruginis]BDZ68611.1 hypothetical protein GCM10025860_20590 [Methanobacterium ferruginis]
MVDAGMYHEFECEIEDQETNGIIKPQEHWNAKHKPVKLLGYELLEEKNVPDSSSEVIFNNLDDFSIDEFLLEYDVITNPTSVTSYLSTYINSVSGLTVKATGHIVHSSAGGHGIDNLAKAALGRNSWVQSHIFKGKCIIQKLNSNYAVIIGSSVCISTDYWSRWDYSSTTSLSSAIESLIIKADNGTFNGILRLWKKLPLNIE